MASPEEGYDCDFVNEVPDDLICSICHLTVKEPVQLGGCGHGMCRACFQQLKEYSEKRFAYYIFKKIFSDSTFRNF